MHHLRLVTNSHVEGAGACRFPKNEFGHFTFTLTGQAITGAEEIRRFERSGLSMSSAVKHCLVSRLKEGYDKSQRLFDGLSYKVVIVPGDEIRRDKDRTSMEVLRYGTRVYGYKRPLAGLVTHMRRFFSDEELDSLDFDYVNALHDKLMDEEGNWHRLGLRHSATEKSWFLAASPWQHRRLPRGGGFLFIS